MASFGLRSRTGFAVADDPLLHVCVARTATSIVTAKAIHLVADGAEGRAFTLVVHDAVRYGSNVCAAWHPSDGLLAVMVRSPASDSMYLPTPPPRIR